MPSFLSVVPRDGGAAVALRVVDLPILPEWQAEARAKGFSIAARVVDRLHLALRCGRCGCVSLSRVFTLRTARPLCPACLAAARSAAAQAAGVRFLRPDPDDTRYGFYTLPCWHEARRQFGLIARAADGETGLRCDTCHARSLEAEAAARGWSLVGPDPTGNPNYRLYAHVQTNPPASAGDADADRDASACNECDDEVRVNGDEDGDSEGEVDSGDSVRLPQCNGNGGRPETRASCGHVQRIARANMITGRFTCAACGQGWPVAASALYLMCFELPGYGPVVKLGFSRDPVSRLQFQLRVNRALGCFIRRIVPVATGSRAIRIEKRMHTELRRRFPEAVIPPRAWAGLIRVRSEIYDAGLEPVIDAMLDRVEASADGRGDNGSPESGNGRALATEGDGTEAAGGTGRDPSSG